MQGTEACCFTQKTARFEVGGLAARIGCGAGLVGEFGFELNAANRPCGRFAGCHATRVAGIDHRDDLVRTRGDLLRGLGQLCIGDGLAVVGQQAFHATVDRRVPIPCAMPREVDEAAPAIACALAQLPNLLEDVFLGGVLVTHHANLVDGYAHGHGNSLGAFHIMGHAL